MKAPDYLCEREQCGIVFMTSSPVKKPCLDDFNHHLDQVEYRAVRCCVVMGRKTLSLYTYSLITSGSWLVSTLKPQ